MRVLYDFYADALSIFESGGFDHGSQGLSDAPTLTNYLAGIGLGNPQLLIAHVMLGVMQYEDSAAWIGLIGLGLGTIVSLHLIAGFKDKKLFNKG